MISTLLRFIYAEQYQWSIEIGDISIKEHS